MATPAEAVQSATLPTLSEVDYGAVFQVVDSINASETGAANVASLVELRLKHTEPKVVALCLELLQACIKNENTTFHRFIATDEFVELLFNLCTSEADSVAKPALKTLQQLGCEHQLRSSMPVFRSAYKQAKAVGLPFPVADDAAVEPLFTPMSGSVVPAEVAPASHASHPEVAPDMSAPPGLARPASAQTSPAPPAAAASRVDADTQQLMTQLDTVRARVGDMTALIDAAQKVQSAESPVSPSGADLLSNETFLDLLDFLEQCHPRVSLLVEAGNAGQLQEAAFESVLELSEPLTRAVNAGKVVSGLVELPAGRTMQDFDIADLVGYGAVGGGSVPVEAPSADENLLGIGAGGASEVAAPPGISEDATADAWAMDFGDEEDGLQSNTLPAEAAAPPPQPAAAGDASDDGLADIFGTAPAAAPAAAAGSAPPAAPAAAPSYAAAAAVAPPTVPASTPSDKSAADEDDDPFLQLATGGSSADQTGSAASAEATESGTQGEKADKSKEHSNVLDEVDDLLAS